MASAFHSILLPIRGDGKGDNVFAHAAVLAHRFGARVRVVNSRPATKDLMPYGVVVPRVVREQIEQAAKSNADLTSEGLIHEFRTLAAQLGLTEGDHTPGVATTRFLEYEGKQVDAVRHYGRLADLICVPQPDRSNQLGANTLKTALFSSGRPVLMCPHADPVNKAFPDHVAIGWNGSLEASRAAALAMPLIESAKEVTILTAGAPPHTATPEEFRRYLELRGIHATIRRFDAHGVVGGKLLQECDDIGAGMLVVGAYHESYERESVFGGNSQVIVDTAKIPVVMVH